MEDLHFSAEEATNYRLITVERLEAALRGDIQIFFGDKAKSYKLSHQALAMYKRAKERQFLVREVGQQQQDQPNLENSYYEYCSITRTCFLVVTYYPYPRRNLEHSHWLEDPRINEDHAIVMYDLFSMRQALTSQAVQQIQACFNRSRPGLYQETLLEVSSLSGRGLVPEYLAEKAAGALYEIISSPDAHSEELFVKING